MPPRLPGRLGIATALALLAAVGPGCRIVDETVRLPAKAVTAMVTPGKPPPVDPTELQSQILRFTDDFAAQSVEGIDDYARLTGTEEARTRALRWKVAAVTAAIGVASGASPYVSLIDLACTTTLTATVLEESVAEPGGEAFRPWLERQRSLETHIWSLATEVFGPEQERELRVAAREWREAHPELRRVFFVRPLETVRPLSVSPASRDRASSVFGLVGLDPVAGLDPAVREVTRTRLLAERAMYVLQRTPYLVRWQTEVLANDLATRPDIARALTNVTEVSASVDRLSRAAESASRTAADLPARFATEREAILAALENQQGRLRDLAAELTLTLGAGDRMSTSLNATLVTFDALMKRFGIGEPRDPGTRNTNSPPFRILDYAQTADRLALAARDLDVLVKDLGTTLDSPALDRRTRDLEAAVGRVQSDTRALLNHAALLAAGLIVLFFAGLGITRRLVGSRAPHPPAPPVS